MRDVVGLHQGVHYEATYQEQGDGAIWTATLARGSDLLLAEGFVATSNTDGLDVSVEVHLAVQRHIDEFVSLSQASNWPLRYAIGG